MFADHFPSPYLTTCNIISVFNLLILSWTMVKFPLLLATDLLLLLFSQLSLVSLVNQHYNSLWVLISQSQK